MNNPNSNYPVCIDTCTCTYKFIMCSCKRIRVKSIHPIQVNDKTKINILYVHVIRVVWCREKEVIKIKKCTVMKMQKKL